MVGAGFLVIEQGIQEATRKIGQGRLVVQIRWGIEWKSRKVAECVNHEVASDELVIHGQIFIQHRYQKLQISLETRFKRATGNRHYFHPRNIIAEEFGSIVGQRFSQIGEVELTVLQIFL